MRSVQLGVLVFAIPNNIPGWPNAFTDFSKPDGWHGFFNWRYSQPDYKADKDGNVMWLPFEKRVTKKYFIDDPISGVSTVPWGYNPGSYTFVCFPPDTNSEYLGFLVYNYDIIEE